jgi:hypothetical protein
MKFLAAALGAAMAICVPAAASAAVTLVFDVNLTSRYDGEFHRFADETYTYTNIQTPVSIAYQQRITIANPVSVQYFGSDPTVLYQELSNYLNQAGLQAGASAFNASLQAFAGTTPLNYSNAAASAGDYTYLGGNYRYRGGTFSFGSYDDNNAFDGVRYSNHYAGWSNYISHGESVSTATYAPRTLSGRGVLSNLVGMAFNFQAGAYHGAYDYGYFDGGGCCDFVFQDEYSVQYYGTATLTAVSAPEPAAWALMIGGFGLAGVALRRRRAVAA